MPDARSRALILIVDDDETNRLVFQSMLAQVGFENLAMASSGPQALAMIADQMPDLVLMDVMMPGMSGHTLTKRIRAKYPDRYLPIILISAIQEPQERVRGILAGANDFVSRPFDTEELIARIDSLLKRKHTLDELAEEHERLLLLYSISQALTSELNYQQTIQKIVTLTTDLTGAAKAILVLLDEQGSFRQKLIARAGQETRSVDKIDPLVLQRGLLGWVIQKAKPVLIPQVSEDARWMRSPVPNSGVSCIPVNQHVRNANTSNRWRSAEFRAALA